MNKRYILSLLLVICVIPVVSCMDINRAILKNGGETPAGAGDHFNIMLVLGSSDPAVRAARIDLACDLLKTGDVRFDRIILSGGCGAHGTDESNCEATDMERLLDVNCRDGISGIEIYKEEGSGSTIQNYCLTRAMQDNGRKLIEKGDTLYVVSSHYHALSVAACFRNDGVDARYYYTCGGEVYNGTAPDLETVAASTDPCFMDYAGIAKNCNTADWCEYQELMP